MKILNKFILLFLAIHGRKPLENRKIRILFWRNSIKICESLLIRMNLIKRESPQVPICAPEWFERPSKSQNKSKSSLAEGY